MIYATVHPGVALWNVNTCRLKHQERNRKQGHIWRRNGKRRILNNADWSMRVGNNKLSLKCQVPKCEQEGLLLLHLGCCTATFLGCWRKMAVLLWNGCFGQGINHAGTMKAGLSTAPELSWPVFFLGFHCFLFSHSKIYMPIFESTWNQSDFPIYFLSTILVM